MDDNDVSGRVGRFVVRRVLLPTRATESFTVIAPDLRPVELVDEYLACSPVTRTSEPLRCPVDLLDDREAKDAGRGRLSTRFGAGDPECVGAGTQRLGPGEAARESHPVGARVSRKPQRTRGDPSCTARPVPVPSVLVDAAAVAPATECTLRKAKWSPP
jgi:hypothetical protein